MLCKVTHCTGCVSANTKPHQLRWGDWEMGTAISCIECSQVAGLIQKSAETPRKHRLFVQLFVVQLDDDIIGYKMGCGPHSKRNNLQCSITPDYGYKRQSTSRGAPHGHTQPEGIGYLAWVAFYRRSNFANFWTKIQPSKQLKATNDTLDRQIWMYLSTWWSILLQTSFFFEK